MKSKLLFILISILLIGCEKPIEFKLDSTDPRIVVEATIENDAAPRVILSKSLDYFSKITPQILAESFVHNAVIEISNGQKTHTLKEYTVNISPGVLVYYYSIDSNSMQTAFKGALNTTYSLKVKLAEKEYTATTTIPSITKKVDSIWWKPVPRDTAGKVAVLVRATDPPGFGDYIRYWTKRNELPFYPGYTSVYDDLLIDGTTYDIEVEAGINRNEGSKDKERDFRRGDTITFKLSNIDKATYDFWRTMEYTYASVGHPFSSPIKVIGNIQGGALGYFGGYATQYHTIIIPR